MRSVVRGVAGKLQLQLKARPEKLEVSSSDAHLFKQLKQAGALLAAIRLG